MELRTRDKSMLPIFKVGKNIALSNLPASMVFNKLHTAKQTPTPDAKVNFGIFIPSLFVLNVIAQINENAEAIKKAINTKAFF